MPGANDSLIAVFREFVQLATLDKGAANSFRVRAYENAIASQSRDLAALTERELTTIGGIGSNTAKKIREFYETGTIAKVQELRVKFPAEFVELSPSWARPYAVRRYLTAVVSARVAEAGRNRTYRRRHYPPAGRL